MGVFPLKHVSHVVKYNGVLWVTDFHGIKRIGRSWEEFLKLQSGIHSILLTRRPSVAITICSSASIGQVAVLLLDWAIMMKKILLNPFFSLLEFIFQIQTERSHTGQPARRRNLQTSNPSTRELRHWSVYCTRNKPEHTGGRLQNRMHNIHQMIHLLPHSPYQLVQKIRRIRGGCVLENTTKPQLKD